MYIQKRKIWGNRVVQKGELETPLKMYEGKKIYGNILIKVYLEKYIYTHT